MPASTKHPCSSLDVSECDPKAKPLRREWDQPISDTTAKGLVGERRQLALAGWRGARLQSVSLGRKSAGRALNPDQLVAGQRNGLFSLRCGGGLVYEVRR